jgi:hypothetical protein
MYALGSGRNMVGGILNGFGGGSIGNSGTGDSSLNGNVGIGGGFIIEGSKFGGGIGYGSLRGLGSGLINNAGLNGSMSIN